MSADAIATAIDRALQAQLDHLALLLLIVSAIGFTLIVWRLAPILREANKERFRMNEALLLLQQAIMGEKESNERQTRAIEALRDDLNKHMITIQLRFDQLPLQLREEIGAQLAAHYSRKGLFRLFG